MAKGDVVSGVGSVAGSSSLTFQPAVGVEVMITSAGVERMDTGHPECSVGLTNGVNEGRFITYNSTAGDSNFGQLRIFLNNTNYLIINNPNASSTGYAYSGIQTK